MKPYRTYRFRTKDPVIDLLRTAIQVAGVKYKKLSEESGVSVGTLYNWFHGPTCRPQYAAVQAVAIVLRHEFRMMPMANVVPFRKRRKAA